MESDLKKRKVEENGGGTSFIDLTREDARKLIEPLTKEQLLDILQDATVRHLEVLEDVRKYADKDPIHRKIFVRGLGWDTSTDVLKNAFSQFGELEEGVVIMDKNTGKSRGYGFVTFKHMDGALNALKEPSKRIDGRMTVCQLASTGPAPVLPAADIVARKIYVGNVPMDLPAERLLNLFVQYGEIEEGPLGFDKQTGRLRGYALFIYKTVEAAKLALEEPVKVLDGHQIFCKLAVEGQRQKGPAAQVQSDAPEPSQAGGAFPLSSDGQYGAVPQGIVTTGVPYVQGVNPAINPVMNPAHNPPLSPAFNPNLRPNLAVSSQNLTGAYSSANLPSNPSVPQSINQGVSQGQTSLGLASYGAPAGTGMYGKQVAGYGGPAYSGVGVAAGYGVAPGSTAAYPAGLQGSGAYPAGLQGSGQYAPASYPNQQMVASYPNQQVAASTAPRAPAPVAGLTPSVPPYYGA